MFKKKSFINYLIEKMYCSKDESNMKLLISIEYCVRNLSLLQ